MPFSQAACLSAPQLGARTASSACLGVDRQAGLFIFNKGRCWRYIPALGERSRKGCAGSGARAHTDGAGAALLALEARGAAHPRQSVDARGASDSAYSGGSRRALRKRRGADAIDMT